MRSTPRQEKEENKIETPKKRRPFS
jgi:hypothetical protein